MKQRILRFNSELHAVRNWKAPNLNKKIHVLVKDNIGVSGFPTSAGSYALRKLNLPDAFCIRQLRKNPEIDVFGKTNLTELAGFVTSNVLSFGYSEIGGVERNPHGNYPCGGSSAGSAIAEAAGFCDAAIGTETRGSLMIPGFRNGVFSFKPTRGSVSRSGIIPLSASFDAPGVLARNLQLLKEVFLSMVGFDPSDPVSFDFRELSRLPDKEKRRILFVVDRGAGELGLIQSRLRWFIQALKMNGFDLVVVDKPSVDFDYKTISSLEIRKAMTSFLQKFGSSSEPKSFEDLVRHYRERPNSHKFGMERLEDALSMKELSEEELTLLVSHNIAKANHCVERLLNSYDSDFLMFADYVDWFAIGGGPSITLPIDFSSELPVSVMLAGKQKTDLELLSLAEEVSRITKGKQLLKA